MNVKIWLHPKMHKAITTKDSVGFTATSDERGRIVIPAHARKQLAIKKGSSVKVTVEPYSVNLEFFGGDIDEKR